jgi:MFS family permease
VPAPLIADPAIGHPRRWSILSVLCGVLIAISLDNTILSIALPSIREQLGASETDLQWITAAYGLVLAGTLLPLAVIGDRYGRRLLLIIGLAIFGVASATAALVDSPNALIVCRGALGLGGACAMPATLAIIGNVFIEKDRGRAISIWSGVAGFGAAAGPLLGGLLLAHFWWGSVFLVNLPVVAVGIVAAVLIVPESRDPATPHIDYPGAALWTGALVGLLFGIIEGPERGWTSAIVIVSLAIAAVLLLLFARRTTRVPAPLLAPRTARHPGMRAGAAVIPTTFFAIFGTQFVITQWLQGPQDLGPIAAAACFIPNAIASVVGSLLNHRLVVRRGHGTTILFGATVMVTGLLLTATGIGTDNLALAVVAFTAVGLGIGFVIPSGVELIMSSASPEQAGSAAGVNETIVEAGGALGVAVMGSVLVGSTSFAWPLPVAAGIVAVGAVVAANIHRNRPASSAHELRSTSPR